MSEYFISYSSLDEQDTSTGFLCRDMSGRFYISTNVGEILTFERFSNASSFINNLFNRNKTIIGNGKLVLVNRKMCKLEVCSTDVLAKNSEYIVLNDIIKNAQTFSWNRNDVFINFPIDIFMELVKIADSNGITQVSSLLASIAENFIKEYNTDKSDLGE